MKAALYTEYGSPGVLNVGEVEKPAPKEKEVLVKVFAATVTTGDVNARGFVFVPPGFKLLARLMFGLGKPKKNVLGFEFAGEIEALGKNTTLFKEGDRVFGIDGMGMGAYAQYKCAAEEGALVVMPKGMSYEEAASVPNGALTALHFLRDMANIQAGQKVLVNGASGSVGSAGVQLARYFGAEVTGVCSTTNLELVKSLGAHKVMDYTKENFLKNREDYDVILDTVGNVPISQGKNSLKENGKLLLVAAGLPQFIQMLWASMGSKKVMGGMASEKKENMIFIKQLLEKGELKTVIDKRFPLEHIVEAHRHVDSGRKKGNVVITIGH